MGGLSQLPKLIAAPLDGLASAATNFGWNGGSIQPRDILAQSAARLSVPRKTHSLSKADSHWNKAFPYLFFLATEDSQTPGLYHRIGSDKVAQINGINKPTFRLEIPPSSMSMNPVFANQVTATNNGILEENAGVLFRQINISGTTGLYPNRIIEGFSSSKGGFKAAIRNFFPSVVDAVDRFAKSLDQIKTSVLGPDEGKFLMKNPSNQFERGADIINLDETGFMKFWEFNNFLTAYAEAKTKTENQDLRLVFYSVKDGVGFVFTTQGFTMSRDAGNPLLYNYAMNMRAWDLFTEAVPVPEIKFDFPQVARVNAIASVTEVLRNTRTSIRSASNVVSGAVSDLNSVMNIYTQAVLVLADTAALGIQVADVTDVLANSSRVLLEGANNTLVVALQDFASRLPGGRFRPINSVTDEVSKFPPVDTTDLLEDAGLDQSVGGPTTIGGETKVTPDSSSKVQASDLLEKFIADPESGEGDIADLDLPETVLDDVDKKIQDAVANTTSNDVRQLADELREISENLASEFNVMDDTYAEVFDVDVIEIERGESRQVTEDDIILLADLEESRVGFLSTLATGELFREKEPDPFAIANENLPEGDALTTPASAFVVAYRRGATLEAMALEFLGDANRGREIALLNGLRAPFTDSEGFDIEIFNANGRSFVIRNEDRIVINQFVTLSGTGVSSTRRTVINIVDIGNEEQRVTVDGQNNLDIYTPATVPMINARIPGTVGAGDFILMPSQQEPFDSVAVRKTPLSSRLRAAEKVFKVDFRLDEKFARDFVVTSDNDIDRIFGYDNAAQAIRLAVETEQGEVEQHPGYGLSVPLAQRTSDIDIREFTASIEERLKLDPRFIDIDAFIDIDGSVARTRVIARGAGGTGLIPLDFEIGRID